MRFLSFLGFRRSMPPAKAPPREAPRPTKSITASDILAGRGGSGFRVERSPDGRSAIVVAIISMRMSHEVEHAVLYALPAERRIAEIGNSLWSADRIVSADEGRGVAIDLRRYPGDAPGVSVAIDIERDRARINAGLDMPVEESSAALEEDYYRRVGAKEGGRG